MKEYIMPIDDTAFDWDEMFVGVIRKQEELIRCKDCKHQRKEYHEDKRRKDGGYSICWCDLVDGYAPLGLDDEYCLWAERKS